ncbi:MAG: bestrophin family ion channel [Cyanobacteria bacterium P01_E01_bin.34]
MPLPRTTWVGVFSHLQGSVILSIWPKVAVCSAFAFAVSLAQLNGLQMSWPVEGSIVPTLVLGLLLVFRTNTAYERFWEGRKAWGTLINTSRNLVRLMVVAISDSAPDAASNPQKFEPETLEHARREKREALRLVAAYSYGLKQHLRGEAIDPAVLPLVPPQLAVRLEKSPHVPLEIAFELGSYFQKSFGKGRVSVYQLSDLHKLLDQLVDVLGICERILKTPVPMAYSIHLRQLLFIYCLTIPFVFVDEFGLWTAIVVGLVAFTVFGIEEIGLEIENPFGRDPNDLPLDGICAGVKEHVEGVLRTPRLVEDVDTQL